LLKIIVQMYKVFINQVPVFFTENNKKTDNFLFVYYKDIDCQFVFDQIAKNPEIKIKVICSDLESDWSDFLLSFQVRKAAGGVVKNIDDKILWIHRFDKWDLPKGHVEKGESKEIAAVREVEEECNVGGLVIDKELETTYHIFEHNGVQVMKITYWFLMHTEIENQILIPQKEEGITEVCFKNKEESLNCLSNTYHNIQILLQEIVKGM